MKKRNLVLFGTTAMLSLAIAGTIGAVTASAATVTGNEGTSKVSYTQESSWSITIPDNIVVGTPVQIEASDVNTVGGLTITVNSKNTFKLKNEAGDDELDYELKIATSQEGLTEATALEQNGEVLNVIGDSGSTWIGAYVANDPSTGGEEYTDTLTFTIAEAE